jgi:Flp pilus assembly protein TadG
MRQKNYSSFSVDERGSTASVFGMILPILLLCMAFGVDMSRLYNVNTRVKGSLDTASLAAAKMLDLNPGATQAEVQAVAQAYFDLNVDPTHLSGATLTNFVATPDFATGTVTTTVNVTVPTLFARSAGSVASTPFQRGAAASVQAIRLEVVLVLDNTGSMGSLTELLPDGKTKLEALKMTAKMFVDTLYQANPKPGYIRVGLAPYSHAVNADAFATALAGPGTNNCVVDRPGGRAYTDDVPTNTSRLGRAPIILPSLYPCPTTKVLPLADLAVPAARLAFDGVIDGMTADGGTGGHMGTAWGWYLLSPKWTSVFGSQAGLPYSTNVQKIVLVLTDGDFNVAYNNGGLNLSWPPTPDATNPLASGSSPYQALRLCDNMKAAAPTGQAISIYTIGFKTTPTAESFLKSCSGDANFYAAYSTNDLAISFKAIAEQITKLRITS